MAPLVWLVTGCTSGFGAQFVHSVTARGDKMVATGRNARARLSEFRGMEGVDVVDLDVTVGEDEVKSIVEKAVAIHGRIDVLVNNAGSSSLGVFEHFTNDDVRKEFDVNFFGAAAVTRAVLPYMRSQNSGTVLFNGSMLGFWTMAATTTYAATKFALAGLAEGLQREVAPFGIRVSVFEPGFFRTGFGAKCVRPTSDAPAAYAGYNATLDVFASLGGTERGDPKKLVELVIDAVRGEGVAKGRKLPLRLPIGPDAVECMEVVCRDNLKVVDLWRKELTGTDRDDYEGNAAAAEAEAVLTRQTQF